MRNADYHDHEYRTRVKWDAAHFTEVVGEVVVGAGVVAVGGTVAATQEV